MIAALTVLVAMLPRWPRQRNGPTRTESISRWPSPSTCTAADHGAWRILPAELIERDAANRVTFVTAADYITHSDRVSPSARGSSLGVLLSV